MDYTIHEILQARILEWVAFPFSRGSSQPRSPALGADSLPAEPQGKPNNRKLDNRNLFLRVLEARNLWSGCRHVGLLSCFLVHSDHLHLRLSSICRSPLWGLFFSCQACGFSPTPDPCCFFYTNSPVLQPQQGVQQFNSDTVYIVSGDPVGSGLSPTRPPPPQMPVAGIRGHLLTDWL